MKRRIVFLMALLVSTAAAAASRGLTCSTSTCSPGDRATTFASKAEPFYTCPTRELADYTALVSGLVAVTYQLTGKLPNISDKTGEPEYLDTSKGPNSTRLMLDHFRHAAKVATFDEAIGQCAAGVGRQKVVVMNVPTDGVSIWVATESGKKYWMPSSHLDRR